MTLADLLALAEKAANGHWYSQPYVILQKDEEFIAACSPEVVAALVRCVMAQEQTEANMMIARIGGERDKLRELLRGMLKLYDALPARLKPPAVTTQEEAARNALKGTE